MEHKSIRVTPQTWNIAKEITNNDSVNFPSKKNVIDKAVLLLKQKLEFDKISSLPMNSNKREWLNHTNIPASNLNQIDLSAKKIEKITQQQIQDLTKKTESPIVVNNYSKSSV